MRAEMLTLGESSCLDRGISGPENEGGGRRWGGMANC